MFYALSVPATYSHVSPVRAPTPAPGVVWPPVCLPKLERERDALQASALFEVSLFFVAS